MHFKNHVLKKVGRGIGPIFNLMFSESTCSTHFEQEQEQEQEQEHHQQQQIRN
jgi:hypothetical protein